MVLSVASGGESKRQKLVVSMFQTRCEGGSAESWPIYGVTYLAFLLLLPTTPLKLHLSPASTNPPSPTSV